MLKWQEPMVLLIHSNDFWFYFSEIAFKLLDLKFFKRERLLFLSDSSSHEEVINCIVGIILFSRNC